LSKDTCEFCNSFGICMFNKDVFLANWKPELWQEGLKVFRELYCTPCLEAKKIFELSKIGQELSWIRELQDPR